MARSNRRVVGEFFEYTTDGTDPGPYADFRPIEGLVALFYPSIIRSWEPAPPRTVFINPFEAITNADGVLVSPDGTEGLYVPITDPEKYVYTVHIIPPDGSKLAPYRFQLEVPAGVSDINISIPPAPPSSGGSSNWLAVSPESPGTNVAIGGWWVDNSTSPATLKKRGS